MWPYKNRPEGKTRTCWGCGGKCGGPGEPICPICRGTRVVPAEDYPNLEELEKELDKKLKTSKAKPIQYNGHDCPHTKIGPKSKRPDICPHTKIGPGPLNNPTSWKMEDELLSPWRDKTVFITGVCGTIGGEILSQVAETNCSRIVGIDNNESDLFMLADKYKKDSRINLYFGDIRNKEQLFQFTRGVHIVFHTAALKHVCLCEESPREAIQTNVIGTQNLIDACTENKVERFIFTSTDKAVNPTNVMGTSKLMGERLISAMSSIQGPKSSILASTRFGNVLGSRGSVIPLFKQQIAEGRPITLTDPNMTRFIMSISEAIKLVIDSVFLVVGGEVFVTKMPSIKITDLAEVMVEELGDGNVEINTIGPRPGEKLFEELINDEEVRRTIELKNHYVVTPALKSGDEKKYKYPNEVAGQISVPYSSKNQTHMSKKELKQYLIDNNLLFT